MLAVFCAGLAIGFAGVAPSLLHLHQFQSVRSAPRAYEAGRDIVSQVERESARELALEDRPVYPYSVVPGGVRNPVELKWAVDHDRVVAAHYAGFDFNHARVVRLERPRLFYVSYRIGGKVYWTRRQLMIRAGEMLITDGKITARSRCGNQVKEAPQQETSTSEPPAIKFDEPVHPATGTAFANPPAPLQTSLLSRPPLPGLGPALPLSSYDPFTGGSWVPLAPPPLPGVCGPVKKPNGGVTTAPTTAGKKGKAEPCGNGGGGGEVPEPGTWLLFGTGLAAISWKMRGRFVRN